ncbi:hypothetical protein GGI13_005813, partial [Coemansia sp. RSA 455]
SPRMALSASPRVLPLTPRLFRPRRRSRTQRSVSCSRPAPRSRRSLLPSLPPRPPR